MPTHRQLTPRPPLMRQRNLPLQNFSGIQTFKRPPSNQRSLPYGFYWRGFNQNTSTKTLRMLER